MTRYFTDEHEWIDVDGGQATVGITDYAQGQLGDIVFVELPAIGAAVTKLYANLVLVVDGRGIQMNLQANYFDLYMSHARSNAFDF